jgi:glycosyltransferase A (GT-A) superfamily protein (DUF2064 family)
LKNIDVVIGPSHDGGYYLLGMKTLHTNLFKEIKWSSEQVFDQTMERIKTSDLRVKILPKLYDIDTIDDLKTWAGLSKIKKSHPVKKWYENAEGVKE